MDCVRQVWEAEHALQTREKANSEHLKRLKEERQIEELKRIQVQQGLIPESSLNMIEWMYHDKTAFNRSEATADEYLLGNKTVTDRDLEENVQRQAAMTEAFTTTENEAFLRLKEDPLMLIRQKEHEQREALLSNPMALRSIKAEIEALKRGSSSHKKHKKHKKRHKRSRSRSPLRDEDAPEEKRRPHRAREASQHDRDSEQRSHHRARNDHPHRGDNYNKNESSRRRHSSSESHQHHSKDQRRAPKDDVPAQAVYRARAAHDPHNLEPHPTQSKDQAREEGRKFSDRNDTEYSKGNRVPSELGPDMRLYSRRAEELQQIEQLRKEQSRHRGGEPRLTQAEKEARAREMQEAAQTLQAVRSHRSERPERVNREDPNDAALEAQSREGNQRGSASFLRKVQREVYGGGLEKGTSHQKQGENRAQINLEDRLNRSRHYRQRQSASEAYLA